VMSKIANEVESTEMAQQQKMEDEIKRIGGITETVSYAVQNIAEELKAKAIVCATTAGYTARSISKYRSRVPIMAFAPNDLTKNQMALSWGVRPFTLSFDYSFNDLIGKIKEHLLKEKLVKKNDVIVVAAGHPFGYFGQTNLIKVEKI